MGKTNVKQAVKLGPAELRMLSVMNGRIRDGECEMKRLQEISNKAKADAKKLADDINGANEEDLQTMMELHGIDNKNHVRIEDDMLEHTGEAYMIVEECDCESDMPASLAKLLKSGPGGLGDLLKEGLEKAMKSGKSEGAIEIDGDRGEVKLH